MGVFKENQVVEVSTRNSPSVSQQRGDDPGPFSDLYLYLITCSWPLLILQISAIFFLANGLFATGYYLDGGVQQARTFSDAYFFSVQTMATIGYGRLTPLTLFSNVLMSVEALTGIFGIAVITGLVFAKFSRPTARVRFSAKAVISTRDGVPSLMFRMANVRENQIVEAQIHVVFSRMERTLEGEETRRFQDLQLV
jgi:inward rectifier potassium channel